MTIQIPNLGTGDGLTGDNELVIRQKYNANFTYLDSKTVAVANTLGTSTTTAASQDLLTKQVGDIGAVLDAVNGVVV